MGGRSRSPVFSPGPFPISYTFQKRFRALRTESERKDAHVMFLKLADFQIGSSAQSAIPCVAGMYVQVITGLCEILTCTRTFQSPSTLTSRERERNAAWILIHVRKTIPAVVWFTRSKQGILPDSKKKGKCVPGIKECEGCIFPCSDVCCGKIH